MMAWNAAPRHRQKGLCRSAKSKQAALAVAPGDRDLSQRHRSQSDVGRGGTVRPSRSRRHRSLGDPMRQVLPLLGVPDLPLTSLILLAVMLALAVLMFGWLSDLLLGDGAFGIALNTVLLLIGAIGAAALWRRFGFPIAGTNPHAAAGLAALAGGLVMLLAAMLLARRR
jgi:uncharacterized membrane protein YeaQ/YmgE (transglycosylase-associated protein family)